MEIRILKFPSESDWMGVKLRALVTVGKEPVSPPTERWMHDILMARHSPIRYLRFSFLIEDLPYWVSVHLCRHIHAQPYVRSQRNDRQSDYDRNNAPQDAPVTMIWDMNAEELLTIANKRLCNKAATETREVVEEMCRQVKEVCPEFAPFLVPMCEYHGCVCHEMNGCGKYRKEGEFVD